MKKYLLSISFILSVLFSFAQKEGNIWYFGEYAGLDFNSGSPVSISNDSLSSNEGCATIADRTTGQVLFYTDGQTVYNSTNATMTNGTGLLGTDAPTESAVIVPQPGSDSLFYIFTTDAQDGVYTGNQGKFCYNVVDMSQSGGLGAVTIKNQVLMTGMTEKIAATPQCGGNGVWVVAHQWGSNAFYAYLVTGAGVFGPIISNSGTTEKNNGNDPGNDGAIGYMRISPDGSMIGVACDYYMHLAEVLSFNNSTGVVGAPIMTDNTWTVTPANGGPYGLSFSPDSRLLYISVEDGYSIYQYNLQAGNSAGILASKLQVGSPTGVYGSGALQIGPDKRIYVAEPGTHAVGALTNPNTLGSGCNFVDTAVILTGICEFGLNDLLETFLVPQYTATLTYTTCSGNGTVAFTDSINGTVSCLWDFGDSLSGTSDSSTLQNPTHTFSGSGIYTIKLYLSNQCGAKDTLTQTDTISSGTLSLITSPPNDTAFCKGNFVQLLATGGVAYRWSPGAGLSDSTIANPIAIPNVTTTYTVTVSPPACGDTTATINITVYPALLTPTITCMNDTLFCSIDTSYTSYQWYMDSSVVSGATYHYYVITQSGNYNVAVSNRYGCNIAVGITTSGCLTGIENLSDEPAFSMYPNPVTDELIVSGYELSGKSTLTVFNVPGEIVFRQEVTGKQQVVNCKTFPPGIYFLQMKTESGNVVKKFIKE